MSVPTEQECLHCRSCLGQAHELESVTSESPSPRLHMPSHWVMRVILGGLGRSVFIDQLWRGGEGLLEMAPQSVPAALLLVGTALRKAEDICRAAPGILTDIHGQILGVPFPREGQSESPNLCHV